jgi:protein ImuB
MFACLARVSGDVFAEALLALAGDFSPRYELVRDDVVLIDIGGLDRIIGPPREIARELARTADARGLHLQVAVAATRTAATLLALHYAGPQGAGPQGTGPHDAGPECAGPAWVVVPAGEEEAAVATLPLSLLAALPPDPHVAAGAATAAATATATAKPRGKTTAREKSTTAGASERQAGGKKQTGHGDAAVTSAGTAAGAVASESEPGRVMLAFGKTGSGYGKTRVSRRARGRNSASNYRLAPAPGEGRETTIALLDTLQRWGLRTLGEVTRLPAADLFERLGPASFWLRRVAGGQDARPLVPVVDEEAFEAELELEWPLETLEPMAFVLGRLLDPLCLRLEQRDRGAIVVHVTLRLVSRVREPRRLELPAPMRDAKVLRTLILLDLESHPPGAGIDAVTIRVDVSPGRIVQHSLLTRATPSPEQLSTLIARLSAVMGDGRVGAPALLDSHRPEAFELRRFSPVTAARPELASTRAASPAVAAAPAGPKGTSVGDACLAFVTSRAAAHTEPESPAMQRQARTLRRFRRPLPVDVRLEQERPVFLSPAPGVRGGRIVQAAGPWRSSGAWWPVPPEASGSFMRPWDRDEWDIRLHEGDLCRIYYDHLRKRWLLESVLD